MIGGGNRFAHAAGLTVAELPGQAYNPLFIYGDAGVGKTHLVQAIGNYVTLCVRGLAVRYATAETFTSEFMAALQRSDLPAFKRRYRQVDVLLLEDVQFLEGKNKTAEEFFYTVDSIINGGAQLVLSADRPPSAMPLLHSRLKERFESGLLVDIAPPDPALKLAVLRKRCGPDADELARKGVLDLLARRSSSNVRSLESALIRSRAFASLTQQPLTLGLVEQVLDAAQPKDSRLRDAPERRLPSTRSSSAPRPFSGSRAATSSSPRRNRRLVYARQVAMYLCRELTDHSLPAIAQQFGGRDHTTVLHAHRKIQRELLDRLLHQGPCGQACGGPALPLTRAAGQESFASDPPVTHSDASQARPRFSDRLTRSFQQFPHPLLHLLHRHDELDPQPMKFSAERTALLSELQLVTRLHPRGPPYRRSEESC